MPTSFTPLLLSSALVVAVQPPRRPVAIEDYYRFKTVSAPQLSPDGGWVAFLVSTRHEDSGRETSEGWVVNAAGTEPPKRVSAEGQDVQTLRWRSDGGIDYQVGRELIRVRPDGTAEPVARPALPRRLEDPTGRFDAVVREVVIPAPITPYATDFERRHAERFRGVTFDWLEFQRDGANFPVADPRSPAADPAGEIWLLSAGAAETGRALTELGLQPRDLAWSPTGDRLVFVADSMFRREGRYPRQDVWTVTVEGRARRLTIDDGFDNRAPAISPDGRRVAFVRTFGTDKVIREKLDHGGPTDLVVMSIEGGPLANLTSQWDLQAGEPTWSRDGTEIFFPATIGGERHLFAVSAAGGPVRQVTSGPRRLTAISFDAQRRRIAYTVTRRDQPAEVFLADIDGRNERQLSHLNDSTTGELALAPSTKLSFRSADGTPLEGWLTLPPGYRATGGPYPLIVASHGGPHAASGEEFDFKTQYFAAAGYLVLETNFRSSTGYGEAFLWGTWGAWGTKDGQDVIAGIDQVVARYRIDRSRIGVTGHSYGGFMTNWLITQYPDRFAAAVTGAGISNWVSDYGTADIARTKETEFFGTPWQPESRDRMIRQSPLSYAGRVRTPTLFVHGEVDQRVPYEEAEQFYVALKKNGVPAKMIVYAGQAHAIRGPWNVVHRMLNERAWWDQWLKRPSP